MALKLFNIHLQAKIMDTHTISHPHNYAFILLAFLISFSTALMAQGKGSAHKEKVVVVDDEACGCELFFVDGIQTTERDGLYGFKREDGTVIIEPTYKFVDKFHDNYCIVFQDYGKCGIIDRNGNVIVPVEYEEVNYPTDGMFRVRQNGLYGFYDTTGKQVIECHYRTTSGFSEGLAVAIIDFDSVTSAYGFIDKKDKIAIPAKYEYAFPFSEGVAIVKNYERFGMINHQGEEVFTCKYLELTPMVDRHFFAVDSETEKAALFNNKFKQLTGFDYEKVTAYQGGYYTVERGGRVTLLDLKGKERFGFYDEIGGFYDGFCMVVRNGKYGIINERGKQILPIEYDNSGYRSMEYIFSENLAMIEKAGKYGFVDRRGNIVVPLIYESAQHCTEGLIPVQLNGLWGFVDKNGNKVCDFEFDAASFFEWGRAEVVYNGEVFKINSDGQCVKNCKNFPSHIKFRKNDD